MTDTEQDFPCCTKTRPEWDELRTEPEYSATIDGVTVLVEKAGGGTIGRTYEGRWNTEVQLPGREAQWVPFATSRRRAHAEVAAILARAYAGVEG